MDLLPGFDVVWEARGTSAATRAASVTGPGQETLRVKSVLSPAAYSSATPLQVLVAPPSTMIDSPVTNPDSGLARYSTASAMS